MPRQSRVTSSTGIYHVMMRGNEKKNIFLCSKDKNKFLHILKEKRNDQNFNLFAYCVMDSHSHLTIQELEEDISTIMKRINTAYAHYFNHRYERVGHVFQDRFRSEPVESESYLLQVIRYIHWNPIKANLCADLFQYPWSSFPQYFSKKPELIDPKAILEMFSTNNDLAFKAFFDYSSQRHDAQFVEIDDTEDDDTEEKINSIIKDFLTLENIDLLDIAGLHKNLRASLVKMIIEETNASIRQIAAALKVDRNIIQRIRSQVKKSESERTVPGDSPGDSKKVSQREPSPVTHRAK